MLSTFVLPLLALAGSVAAELQIVRPSSASWWVATEQNTVQWVGLDPAVFAISVFNSNVTLLGAGSAVIQTQNNAFDLSYTLVPQLNPGTGYTIKLHNVSDPTNVFATSETFEVKPPGSTYPPLITTLASSAASTPTSAAAGGAGASASTTAAAASGTSTQRASAGEQSVSNGGKLALIAVEVVAVAWGLERLLL